MEPGLACSAIASARPMPAVLASRQPSARCRSLHRHRGARLLASALSTWAAPQIAQAQALSQVQDALHVAGVVVIVALAVGVVALLRVRRLRRGTEAAFDDRLEFERLLTDLSGVFANVPSERVEAEVQTALERLLRALDLGRISFFRFSAADGRMSLVHSVAAKGFEPGYSASWNAEYPWYVATLARGDIVRLDNLPDDLPPAAENERAAAVRTGLRSSLAIPLRVGGEVTAAISFGDFRAPRKWSDEQIARLQVLGNVFANALQRRAADQTVQGALQFERLLADLSGVFANVPPERVEAEIQQAMERLLAFLDLDRLTFLEISRSSGRLHLLHSVTTARGGVPARSEGWEEEFPWWSARVHQGELVFAEDVSRDLPDEAWRERAYFDALGIRAVATIPLRVGGKVTAAIGFSDFRSSRRWSQDLLLRLQTLGEVFANALERKGTALALTERLVFEKLLAELSGVFANAPPDEVEAEIRRAMERLLTFLDLDRLTFLEIPRDTGRLRLLNSVTSPRGVTAYPTGWEEAFPWWTEQLHRGDVVFAEDVSRDLPPEAEKERTYFESVGIRATATIPLRVGGEVRAAIGFSDFRTSRQWPRELLLRLQTLGEVFANALARRAAAQALTERLEFERLLTELSANFANVPSERIHAEIPRALERLLDFLKLDRGALLVIRPKDGRLSLLHVANRAGVPPIVQVDWEEELPLWARLVHDGETVIWPNPPDCLPAEAEKERARVLHLGIRAHLAIPLQVGGRVTGAICFADFKASRDWPPELVSRLRTLSEIFANALQRKAADEALEAKLNFERLLADLSAKFANLPGECLETEIGRAMEGLIEFFHLDRSTMLEVSHDTGKLRLVYSAVSEFGVPAASGDWEDDYPWWTGKVARGEIVVIEQLADDFPPEAEAERAYYASIGLKSSLIVPMMVGGKFTGTLGFSDFRASRKWPEETIARLKTLADIFANALERRARDRELATRLEFAMFVADLSATFANVPGERVESQIELAMRRLLDVLDLDRCGFMIISKEDGRLRALRSVTRGENVPAILGNLEEAFPWWSGPVAARRAGDRRRRVQRHTVGGCQRARLLPRRRPASDADVAAARRRQGNRRNRPGELPLPAALAARNHRPPAVAGRHLRERARAARCGRASARERSGEPCCAGLASRPRGNRGSRRTHHPRQPCVGGAGPRSGRRLAPRCAAGNELPGRMAQAERERARHRAAHRRCPGSGAGGAAERRGHRASACLRLANSAGWRCASSGSTAPRAAPWLPTSTSASASAPSWRRGARWTKSPISIASAPWVSSPPRLPTS